MKTAIQQLIHEADSYSVLNKAGKIALKNLLEKKLTIERRQILDAFVAGDERENSLGAEQYYNQKFKNL